MALKEAYICLKASPGKMNKIKYQWESSSPIVIINSLRPTLSKVQIKHELLFIVKQSIFCCVCPLVLYDYSRASQICQKKKAPQKKAAIETRALRHKGKHLLCIGQLLCKEALFLHKLSYISITIIMRSKYCQLHFPFPIKVVCQVTLGLYFLMIWYLILYFT